MSDSQSSRRQSINSQHIPVNHQTDSHNRIFPVEIGEYKVDSVAGVGVYGIVLLAHLKSNPDTQFAIKGFFSPKNNDAEFATTFREIEIAKYVSDHPNIVQPIAALSASNMVQIPNGSGGYTIENNVPINFTKCSCYSIKNPKCSEHPKDGQSRASTTSGDRLKNCVDKAVDDGDEFMDEAGDLFDMDDNNNKDENVIPSQSYLAKAVNPMDATENIKKGKVGQSGSLYDLSRLDSKGIITSLDIEKFLAQNKKITTKDMILALKQMLCKVDQQQQNTSNNDRGESLSFTNSSRASSPDNGSVGSSRDNSVIATTENDLEYQINETLKFATSQALIQASIAESRKNPVFLWSDTIAEKRNSMLKHDPMTDSQISDLPTSMGSECSNCTEAASSQNISLTQSMNMNNTSGQITSMNGSNLQSDFLDLTRSQNFLNRKIQQLPTYALGFMISSDEEAKEYLKEINTTDQAESQEANIGFAIPKSNAVTKPRFYFWHRSFGARLNGIPSYQKISQFLVLEFLPKTLSVRLAEIVIEAIVTEGKTLAKRVKERLAGSQQQQRGGNSNDQTPSQHIYGTEKFIGPNGQVILNGELQQLCTQEDYSAAALAANKYIAHNVLHIIAELVAAVAHMHSKTPPVVHRDIKYDQIMFTKDNLLRLCDFGLARVVDKEINRESNYLRNAVKNRSRHPACLLGGSSGKLEIDVWAIGCLALQLAQFSIQACKTKLRANSISITAIHNVVTDPKNAVGTPNYIKILSVVSSILHKMLEETFPFEVQCSHLIQKWNSIFADLFDTKGADDIYYAAAMFKFIGLPSSTEIRDVWAKLPLWTKLYERYLPALQTMLDARQFNDVHCKENLKLPTIMPLFAALGPKALTNVADLISKFFTLKAKYTSEKGPNSVLFGYNLSEIINGGIEII